MGVEVIMMTGDSRAVADAVGRDLGIDVVLAEVLPGDKAARIDAVRQRGKRVAMVGDGVNDAPALAAGNLGIAMGAAGSDIAMNSASVALMSNDLRRLPFLVSLSRAMTRVIWQNLILGVSFIIVVEIFIVFGNVHPMLAALLHTVSSAIVVFNSARLVRFGEQFEAHAPPARRPAEPAPSGRVALQPV